MSDLTRLTAAEIADALRRGDTTSVEVTRAHLDRIAAVDQAVHAFLQVDTEGALVQARAPLLRMSSLHDLEHGRPLEIEETVGYVVTQAATVGLAVPTVDTCYRLMRGLNRCMQRASG